MIRANRFYQFQNAAHARTMASAFMAARTTDEMFAALRFHWRMTGEELCSYLSGSIFGDLREADELFQSGFDDARDDAEAFLEGLETP